MMAARRHSVDQWTVELPACIWELEAEKTAVTAVAGCHQ